MEKVTGIIFDMDGLLFDTEKLYYQGTRTIADKMHIPYRKETYLRFVGVADEDLWAHYHELYADFGKETVDKFIHDAYAETRQMFLDGKAELKPGVPALLDYLNQRRIPKVLASSNNRQMVDLLLQKAGLSHEFSDIISCEDVHRAKPDPEIFELAAERLGTKKTETLVLEDSDNGVIAASRADIPVIMIPDLIAPTEELKAMALKIFDSLSEIPKFLENK